MIFARRFVSKACQRVTTRRT